MSKQTSERTVDYELENSIARIYLNRPHRLNAVTPALVEDLCIALDRACEDQVRVAVLSGRGRAFCAGFDLRHDEAPVDEREHLRRTQRIQDVTRKVRRALFPVVASVQGYALGAGCEFALCCDLIVASRDAQFGFPEVSVGLSVTGGISHVLPRSIGLATAKELLMLGEHFGAERAWELGLINQVVEPGDLESTVATLVEKLRDQPPLSLSMAKVVLDQGSERDLEAAMELEVHHAIITGRSDESAQAAEAFRKK